MGNSFTGLFCCDCCVDFFVCLYGKHVSKLTKHARGQDCQIRYPGICNHNPETVVACHLPSPMKGIGKKSEDLHIAFGCSSCHDVLDGRNNNHEWDRNTILLWGYEGMVRTQLILKDAGLIKES
jgi:hypothetical protein